MTWLGIWVEAALLAGMAIGRVIGWGNPLPSEPEPVPAPAEEEAAPAVKKSPSASLPAVGSFW
ncbi:hypothetical protein GOFOIKOB_4532 [Methylobacterium tardum]|uniref:Uncharacterized protein n=2 Tax=Methylobacterium tardum TaxID=374432 RepID=A0AA37WUW7_9HYPH|nr:hypothetical protein [Methylobacterium tardum]GJE51473.1 hypothetical protein GOFOIKOB_4532 [Methylobacterium tardum]GLS73629.1 hypothetical protein GCM10007890_56440 [Methylobacterium tardum]